MASQFTTTYKKARDVATMQKFAEPEWEKFFTDVGLKSIMTATGFDSGKAETPEKIRAKFAELAKDAKVEPGFAKAAGKFIYDACQNASSNSKWTERAATIEFMRHLYRARKSGAQDVWVYSPPVDYGTQDVFQELSGSEAHNKRFLGYDDEIFTAKHRDLMCDALSVAKKAAGDCVAKLGSPNQATKDVISRWFIDADSTDKLDEAATKLNDGMKKIWAGTGSTTLVFTDYLAWRYTDRFTTFGAAFAGGEGGGFPVIYLEGAFTKLAGNADKLWLCAQTILHELSHHEVKTEDHRYDFRGLKPGKHLPYATAIDNADSWGYFAMDLGNALSDSDRTKVLK
jgi:hypothetical protein